MRIAISVILTAGLASSARAAILSGSAGPPAFVKIAPPSVVFHDLFQEDKLFGFDERQEVVLTAPLIVDVLADGMGGGSGPGVLPAGFKVSSHYIFYDPKNLGQAINTVDFDGRVVGIITTTANLDASDFLGAPGTTYNTTLITFPYMVGLGLEVGDNSSIVDFNRISVNLTTTSGDFLRVLTAVPEPSTLVVWFLLATCGLGLGFYRRKRRSA